MFICLTLLGILAWSCPIPWGSWESYKTAIMFVEITIHFNMLCEREEDIAMMDVDFGGPDDPLNTICVAYVGRKETLPKILWKRFGQTKSV